MLDSGKDSAVRKKAAQIVSVVLTLAPVLTAIFPWVQKTIKLSVESRKILDGAYATQQAQQAEQITNATDKPIPQKLSELQSEISRGSLPAYALKTAQNAPGEAIGDRCLTYP